jgi:hypothetical protein
MRSKYALLEALITWLPDAHMYMHLVYWEGRPFLPALLISLARAGVQVLFAAGLQALLDWRSQGQISKQAAAKGTPAPVSNSVSQKIESLNGTLSHDKSAGAYLKGHTSPCKESSNKGYSSTACSAAPSKLLDAADCEPIKCGATGDAQTPAAAAAARPNDEGRVIQRAAAQVGRSMHPWLDWTLADLRTVDATCLCVSGGHGGTACTCWPDWKGAEQTKSKHLLVLCFCRHAQLTSSLLSSLAR